MFVHYWLPFSWTRLESSWIANNYPCDSRVSCTFILSVCFIVNTIFSMKRAKTKKACWNSEVSDISFDTVTQEGIVPMEPQCTSTESPNEIISSTDAVNAVANEPETS